MEIINELKEKLGGRYNFAANVGYLLSAFNFYMSINILFGLSFNVFLFIVIYSIYFASNFVFCGITNLYIDIQTDQHIRSKEVFYLYGITEFISFLFIPIAIIFINHPALACFLINSVFLLIWLIRVFIIKKISKLGYINSFIAAFFPYILMVILSFVIIVISTIMILSKIYG